MFDNLPNPGTPVSVTYRERSQRRGRLRKRYQGAEHKGAARVGKGGTIIVNRAQIPAIAIVEIRSKGSVLFSR